jgi:hypothetical protein
MTRVRIQVVDEDTGWLQELALIDHDQALLSLQLERQLERGTPEAFARWLMYLISAALPDSVDYDLRPPSQAQVNFATAIARALGLALPSDVLRYRGPTHEFISTHKDTFNARRPTARSTDDQVG